MPLAPVDDRGTQLYYEDSGEMSGSYTTVVIVHGTAFHGAIFRRMFQHAAAHKLRLVTINRREYPGSTPLSDDDLRAVAVADVATGREIFRRQSIEIARFLAWFLETESIPPAHDKSGGGETGGIILLGWSSGWAYIAPLLGDADTVPADLVQALSPYFRGLCALDVPRLLLGLPLFEGANLYHPVYDDALTFEEYSTYFQIWVSSYYLHADVFAWRAEGLTEEILDSPPEGKRATTEEMTTEEKMSLVSVSAVERFERPLLRVPASNDIFLDTTHKIFGKNESPVWPKCKIYMMWCEHSVWETVMGAWHIQDLYKARKEKGEAGRELVTMFMPECNHFVSLDHVA
ncbi:hypothetical protein EVG20_g10612 [Dentipellis fragilis]|uniref:AB hydrolase-1 domain-containing protein n=1 Tax=Dentipellis fragilis TaxID=205917 RepID=A0A4Y9XPR0_9AGAM|nr:hypothetical protein EVG20_g10612 [Dentipellis fragilis]